MYSRSDRPSQTPRYEVASRPGYSVAQAPSNSFRRMGSVDTFNRGGSTTGAPSPRFVRNSAAPTSEYLRPQTRAQPMLHPPPSRPGSTYSQLGTQPERNYPQPVRSQYVQPERNHYEPRPPPAQRDVRYESRAPTSYQDRPLSTRPERPDYLDRPISTRTDYIVRPVSVSRNLEFDRHERHLPNRGDHEGAYTSQPRLYHSRSNLSTATNPSFPSQEYYSKDPYETDNRQEQYQPRTAQYTRTNGNDEQYQVRESPSQYLTNQSSRYNTQEPQYEDQYASKDNPSQYASSQYNPLTQPYRKPYSTIEEEDYVNGTGEQYLHNFEQQAPIHEDSQHQPQQTQVSQNRQIQNISPPQTAPAIYRKPMEVAEKQALPESMRINREQIDSIVSHDIGGIVKGYSILITLDSKLISPHDQGPMEAIQAALHGLSVEPSAILLKKVCGLGKEIGVLVLERKAAMSHQEWNLLCEKIESQVRVIGELESIK